MLSRFTHHTIQNAARVKRWRPRPRDTLTGVLHAIDDRCGPYGAYPVVVVRLAGGDLMEWHCWHAKARRELDRLHLEVGQRISVQYLGQKQSSDPRKRPYHDYHVSLLYAGVGDGPRHTRPSHEVTLEQLDAMRSRVLPYAGADRATVEAWSTLLTDSKPGEGSTGAND